MTLPGGLGDVKWADRTLVDALSAPGRTPLICDLDGSVLEAGYAAVLLVAGDKVLAPPLDGRVLDSISRRDALRAAARAGMNGDRRDDHARRCAPRRRGGVDLEPARASSRRARWRAVRRRRRRGMRPAPRVIVAVSPRRRGSAPTAGGRVCAARDRRERVPRAHRRR